MPLATLALDAPGFVMAARTVPALRAAASNDTGTAAAMPAAIREA